MTNITTADCKKFIVQFQKNNPNLERSRYRLSPQDNVSNDPEYQFLTDALIEKNWKRIFKTTKDFDEHSNYVYIDGQLFNRYAEPAGQVNYDDIKCIRGFDLDSADGQIAYLILEMKDGTLHLGDYIGD
jgi:hypothetical protein